GEPLEFGWGGRANPLKIQAGEGGVGLFAGELAAVQWIGAPEGVAIALLVQAAVGGQAADVAGKLQPIKGQGQGRSEALPPAIRTEAAGLRADRGADPVRLGGTVLESQQDGVAEGVDLLGGDA